MLRLADGDSGCVERYAGTATAARTHRLADVRTVDSRCGSAFCLSQQAAPALPRIGRTVAEAEGQGSVGGSGSFGGLGACGSAGGVGAATVGVGGSAGGVGTSPPGSGSDDGSGTGGAAGRGEESTVGVSTGSVGAGGVCTEPEGTVGVGVGVPNACDGGLEEPAGCAG